ncbi:PilZ domain-containing protein [Aurantiacibacter gilvus]|uniref:PilZ domain-containing protein n=1 Tax=Aurantiacibacter gilvus TaxID=3139141 RepID=A0ABU9IBN3_9SPHN
MTLDQGLDEIEQRRTTRVLIIDLSTTGMRIQTSASFQIGENIELVLPEAGPITATIVREAYSDFGYEFGVAFDEPIGAAVVSAVQLAAPAFAPPTPDDSKDHWVHEAQAKYPDVQPISNLILVILLTIAVLVLGGLLYGIGFLTFSE